LAQIYEGMYLLDNAAVREGWDTAKSIVTATLEKHGATLLSARRWDERRLSYPIKGKNRATYLLTYYNIPGSSIPAMRRDFELNETVLRSLELAVDEIPESESEHVTAEGAEDFKVPTPPDDDHVDFVEEPEDEFGNRPRREDREAAATEGSADADKTDADKTEGDSTEATTEAKTEDNTEAVEKTEEA
jgi:small subunit ribosomal protein S6